MGTGAKILVVDDDPDMRDALQMILESGGYTVVMAEDGEKCLAKLKEEQPDLLILDLLMPRMDGFEVCKALKDPRHAKYGRVPIIILSSVQEGVSQRRYELETGVQLDVDDYVEKPVESSVLLERVGKIIKRIGKE
ncbi:MAG: response regulator [Deltaproteobacteria bacterium]|nr:response regulator [Deltaproteobacteria bacterium]MBW2073355.1 response regulator [Deltaproteobacteria bacterium]